jgi:hypothetical protein
VFHFLATERNWINRGRVALFEDNGKKRNLCLEDAVVSVDMKTERKNKTPFYGCI